jgi:tetratricopeptide (TPR) repeat protein
MADDEYKAIIAIWTAGDQLWSEVAARQAVKLFPKDSRFPFFALCCALGRGGTGVAEENPFIDSIVHNDIDGPRGEAVILLNSLDAHVDVEKSVKGMIDLAAKHPDDPLFTWLAGTEAFHNSHGDLAIPELASLIGMVQPGSVVIHSEYAFVLESMRHGAEALAQRQWILEHDPSPGNYDAIAKTLSGLGRGDEADAAFDKCTSMEPEQYMYWMDWAWSKRARGETVKAQEFQAKGQTLQEEQRQRNNAP